MANNPGSGHDGFMQMAVESTAGTAPAAAQTRLEVVTADMQVVNNPLQDPSLSSFASRRANYKGAQWGKLRMTQRMNYDGFGPMLKAIWGASTVGAATDSQFPHTFKEASQLPSYTIEVSLGDIPSGKVLRLVGAKCTSAKFSIKASEGGSDGMLMLDTEWVGMQVIDPTGAGTTPMTAASLPSVFPILFSHMMAAPNTVIGTGDTLANLNVLGWELNIPQPHKPRPRMGTLTSDEPKRSDFVDPTWGWTLEYQGTTPISQSIAFTPAADPQIKFQDTTLLGATSKRELTFRIGNPTMPVAEQPISGYGIIEQNLQFLAAYDTVDATAVICILGNGESGSY